MVQFLKSKRYAYQKQAIKDGGVFTTEELISETKRLNRLVNKRLERLEKAYPRADILKNYEKRPEIGSFYNAEGDLNYSSISSILAEDYRFLNRKTTTVTGYRRQLRKTIGTFNSLLKKKVFNEENIFDLLDFLEDYREKYKNQQNLDSERVLDIYSEMVERVGMSPDNLLKNLEYWYEHRKEIANIQPVEDDSFSSDKYSDFLRSKLV